MDWENPIEVFDSLPRAVARHWLALHLMDPKSEQRRDQRAFAVGIMAMSAMAGGCDPKKLFPFMDFTEAEE